MAALPPSAPETRIPEERGEWRVYGLFDDEGILSELEWSWQAPGGRSIETGVQQPTQNEESLIFREDKNGMIVSVDGTYRHMTGIVPEELQGTAILSIGSPAEREADIPGPSCQSAQATFLSVGVSRQHLAASTKRTGTTI